MLILALVLIVIFAIGGIGTDQASTEVGSPEPAGTPIECLVTQPNGVLPPEDANVFNRGSGDYGNDYLWTSLWTWGNTGTVIVPETSLLPDGTAQDLKWPWYRFVEGELTIEGHRLDADAPPLQASVMNESYGSGFIPSGLTFPTDGCWEITGTVGDEGSLTFVVLVVWPDGFVPVGTPEATQKIPDAWLAAGSDNRFNHAGVQLRDQASVFRFHQHAAQNRDRIRVPLQVGVDGGVELPPRHGQLRQKERVWRRSHTVDKDPVSPGGQL